MEYLDLLDENRNLIGQKVLRESGKPIIPQGKYINIIIVYIQNSKGEFLMQKTSKEKGSVFATTGGFVKSGATSKETAIIEVLEELGININEQEVALFKTYVAEQVYYDVYYLKKDIEDEEFNLQKEEVEYVEWLSIEKIKELIEKEEVRKSNIESFLELIESDLIINNN